MGQKKARTLKSDKTRSEELRGYIESYLSALRALQTVPPFNDPPPEPALIAAGRAEIWPCEDGAIVLFYKSSSGNPQVHLHDPIRRTARDFSTSANAMRLLNESGQRSRFQVSFGPEDSSEFIFAYR